MITAAECKTYSEFVEKYQWYVYPILSARLGRLLGGPVDTAIDMGTGPGYLTAYLARDHAKRVHAVDINPAMHELARITCVQSVVAGAMAEISFDIADVHKLPYPESYADLVVSYSCFHHWQDPVRALQECIRVVKPGGVLYLIDTDGGRPDVVSIINETVHEPEYFRFVSEAFEESYNRDQVFKMASRAGLEHYSLGEFTLEEQDVMAAMDDFAPGRELPRVSDADPGPVTWELIVRKA